MCAEEIQFLHEESSLKTVLVAVCDLLAAGVSIIASLTSCSEALLVDSLLGGLSVPHAVLPFPLCPPAAAPLLAATSVLIQTNASAIAAATTAILRKMAAERLVLLADNNSGERTS